MDVTTVPFLPPGTDSEPGPNDWQANDGTPYPFNAPTRFLITDGNGKPDPSGRLSAALRSAAQTQDTREILTRAACVYYLASHRAPGDDIIFNLFRSQNLLPDPLDAASGDALADLAVTGRVTYETFKLLTPKDFWVIQTVTTRLAPFSPSADVIAQVTAQALDRAYRVAWMLRGPSYPGRVADRTALGWIAVSSEDDFPHRRVNLPSINQPQYEIPVKLRGLTVQTRFFIASAGASPEMAPPPPAPRLRLVPPDPKPVVPDGDQVILFIHGAGSSSEEVMPLILPLHQAGLERGVRFSIVSLDLPTSGCSTQLDHHTIAPTSASSFQAAPVVNIGPIHVTSSQPIFTPVLDFIEDFIVEFVNQLDPITPIKNRFAGVIGGSLGGNLGLRLGRRDYLPGRQHLEPWLDAGIVSWSAASVWRPLVESLDSLGPVKCFKDCDAPEDPSNRSNAHDNALAKQAFPLSLFLPAIPDTWYSDHWRYKQFFLDHLLDGFAESYNPTHNQWWSRVDGEQLIFSHVDLVVHGKQRDPSNPVRFECNRVRELLIACADDDYDIAPLRDDHLDINIYWKNLSQSNFKFGGGIYSDTLAMAPNMINTPGRAMYLLQTGHSVHAERPRFLSEQIASFLIDERVGVRPAGADGKELALFRLFNAANGDHFYTTSVSGRDDAVHHGYALERIECAVLASNDPAAVPLYRLLGKDGHHKYTSNTNERSANLASGYTDEGIACGVLPQAAPGASPLHRLHNAQNGDFFYTIDPSVTTTLPTGYAYEGIQCWVYPPAGKPRAWHVPPLTADDPAAAFAFEGARQLDVVCRGRDGTLAVNEWSPATGAWSFISLGFSFTGFQAVQALGGAGAVALVRNGQSQLDTFVRGMNGHLLSCAWDGKSPTWTDHQSPTGQPLNGAPSVTAVKDPTAESIVHAFIVGAEGRLHVRYQSGAAWSWGDRGAPTGDVPLPGSSPSAVSFVQGDHAEIYTFVASGHGHLLLNVGTAANGAWTDLGAPPNTTLAGSPAALTMMWGATRRFYAFVCGKDGRLYACYWDGAAWHWTDQGAPQSSVVGRPGACWVAPPPRIGTGPLLVHPAPAVGQLYVAVRGADYRLYLNAWDGTQWSWRALDTPSGQVLTSGVTALVLPVGISSKPIAATVCFFGVGSDGHLYQCAGNGDEWAWADQSG